MIHMNYLSSIVSAALRWNAQIRDGEPKSFRIYRIISVYGDLCIPPNRRADKIREINEMENSAWMREPCDPKSP